MTIFTKSSILDVRQSSGYGSLLETKKLIVLSSVIKTKPKKRTILDTSKRHSAGSATHEAIFSKFVTVRSSCWWDNFQHIGCKNFFLTRHDCFKKVYRSRASIMIKTRLFQVGFLEIFKSFSEWFFRIYCRSSRGGYSIKQVLSHKSLQFY